MRDPLSQDDRGTGLTPDPRTGGHTPVRVIGVGSPFGADSLGWDAVDALSASGVLADYPDGLVTLQRLDRPGAALLEMFAVPGLVILVDAMRSGRTPGTVVALDPEDLDETGCLMSTHDFGIDSALRLARALGEIACELRIFGIEMDAGAPDATREPPAPPPEMEKLIQLINELITDFVSRRHYPPGPDLVRINRK